MTKSDCPRGIAVVDVGYTNTKVMLFSAELEILGERKIASPHSQGSHYRVIDDGPILAFLARALPELDAIRPIDTVVPSAHGACIVSVKADGTPAVPIMDYMSEPPAAIASQYAMICPSFAETYCPQLPVALLHAMQLFWQKRVLPGDFATTTTILPLMQYIAARLGGSHVSEISAMGCQSHLLDMNTFAPSSLAKAEGWANFFAPRVKAWNVIGTLGPQYRGGNFSGRGEILAGVHDSNANFLRYLAAGLGHFTLLSTGTWIIGFDSDMDVGNLDPSRDTVANVNVLGQPVACCRFFGGKEFEVLARGASGDAATIPCVQRLIGSGAMALPSFTDSGGPVPNTGGKGRVVGMERDIPEVRTSLASLYSALMVSESLDAINSRHDIIVDGPFSQNHVFLSLLATLRATQRVMASDVRDGTAAGAACLALMSDGLLPRVGIAMRQVAPARIDGLREYQTRWKSLATAG